MLKKITRQFHSRISPQPRRVTNTVLSKNVTVRAGTIPEKPDYDTAWILALLGSSHTFIDVGCNLGWISLISCLDNPERLTIAVDPNPDALTITAENLFLNGFSHQVRFVQAFLSDRKGQVIDFFTIGAGAAGSRYPSHAKTASAAASRTSIKTATLDEICADLQVSPDFIKIDVEGEEYNVLRGAVETTRAHQPRYLVEMHATDERSMQTNGDLVLAWCQDSSYDCYYLKTHDRVNSAQVFQHRGRCHLLLQPANRAYPASLAQIEQGTPLSTAQSLLSGRQP